MTSAMQATPSAIKVLVILYTGSLFYSADLEIVFFVIICDEQSTLLSEANQNKDLIQESFVENSYALPFTK